jgi:S1-C subfamily serine protease
MTGKCFFSACGIFIGLSLAVAPAAAVAQEAPPAVAFGAAFAPGDGGVEVPEVIEGLTASLMGVKAGDVIMEAGGKETPDPDALIGYVKSLKPGDTTTLTVKRGGQTLQLSGKATPRPAGMQLGIQRQVPRQ